MPNVYLNKTGQLKSPIVDGDNVIFYYSGNADTIFVAGDYNRWELRDRMKKCDHSELWYFEKKFPPDARLDYKFIVDGNWINDPLNSFITPETDNSTLFMPEYKSDYDEIIKSQAPGGRLIENLKIHSRYYEKEMTYHIYLPFQYRKGNIKHILYALDGLDYINFSKINLILDYMIDRKEIPDTVAVLADPHDRDTDYTISKPYYNYFTRELMPLVENEYISRGPDPDRAIIGVSWGGLTAVYLAVTSHAFKRVLSQSGSFWPRGGLIYKMIKEEEFRRISFMIQTGTIEDTEEMNDIMVEILKKKGYPVQFVKFSESHRWSNWKGHLNEGLKMLYKD